MMKYFFKILRLILEAKRPVDRIILVVGFAAILVVMGIWSMAIRGNQGDDFTNLSSERIARGELSGAYGEGGNSRGPVTLHHPVAGELVKDATDVWTFAGAQGQHITVALDGPWASHLEFARPDEFGRMAEAFSDLGGGLAIVCNKELPVSGDYRIFVSGSLSRPDNNSGPYTLIVRGAGDDAQDTAQQPEITLTETSLSIVARSACGEG